MEQTRIKIKRNPRQYSYKKVWHVYIKHRKPFFWLTLLMDILYIPTVVYYKSTKCLQINDDTKFYEIFVVVRL